MLRLRAEAADEASLQKIQDMLITRLEKFGRRERLTVTWQPSGTPAADSSQPGLRHAGRSRTGAVPSARLPSPD
jgi:hypothetical protein